MDFKLRVDLTIISLPLVPSTHKDKNLRAKSLKRKAFTLAETLITLSIIGVIAALTVPTLVANSQEAGFRSAFLKNYSIISNAYIQSIRNGVPFWDPNFSNQDNWMISPVYQQNPKLIKDYFKVHGEPKIATNGAGPYAVGYFTEGKNPQKYLIISGNT